MIFEHDTFYIFYTALTYNLHCTHIDNMQTCIRYTNILYEY